MGQLGPLAKPNVFKNSHLFGGVQDFWVPRFGSLAAGILDVISGATLDVTSVRVRALFWRGIMPT